MTGGSLPAFSSSRLEQEYKDSHEIRFEINNIFPAEMAGLSFGPSCEVGSSRLLGADTTCR